MAVLSLAGAYVLIALSTGGEQSSSETGQPAIGGNELPLEASGTETEAAVAEGARTLETPAAGGPDAAPVKGGGERFELTLPPGWTATTTTAGSDLYTAADGNATILIRVEDQPGDSLGDLADGAAAYLAELLPAGATVKRIPSRPEGALLAVARTKGSKETKTAYVASAGSVQYLVVSRDEGDASAMDRLEAEGIVRSFKPTAAK
jgi:hypothetical protein